MKRLGAGLVLVTSMVSLLHVQPAFAALAPPVHIAPGLGATLAYPTEPPLFRWTEVAGAVSYRIEIDDASDFIDPLSTTTANSAYALTTPQTIGQPFYWRVQSVASTGRVSDWSPFADYSIAWPNSSPTLLSPPDGDPMTDVVFSWEPVAGAASYQIQVSPNGDWANNVSIDTTVKSTTYSPVGTLDNASYFWRVRPRDSASPANAGSWSSEWQFTREWSDVPQLVAPLDSPVASVSTPTLAWEPVPHASHYEVQLGTDINFSPSTFSVCFTNHTQVTYFDTVSSSGPSAPGGCGSTTFKSAPGTAYAWRVRGVDGPTGAVGPWSEVRQFLFRGAASDVVTLVSPADEATVSTPSLTWSPVPDIERYKVTIEKPGGGTSTVTTAATSWTPTSPLDVDDTFTWFVQTVDSHGKLGVIGEDRRFTLGAPTTAASPEPLTPANGSSSHRMPRLTWTPATGADYYEVWYSVEGSPVEAALSGTKDLPFAGYTYDAAPLPPGTYSWYVKAFDPDSVLLATGSSRTFTIATIGEATPTGPCDLAQTPCTIEDTPTLSWEPEPGAGSYLVYIAQDAGFTNVIKTYQTQYTTLTPRESLLDNQAGKAYYWFVRPCITDDRCGRFDVSVFDEAFAFRKQSQAIELVGPADGSSVPDLVTFAWVDYLVTNLADPDSPTQEAKQYRIQVSTAADFSAILDEKTVDQTTFTPFDRTYPEGILYWRVQAIDGSGNALTRSATWSLVKSSPKISLYDPEAGAVLVADLPTFTWKPQPFAARYELEMYRDGDLNFSPANRVVVQQTKLAAWAATKTLLPGSYAWRVRRLDADNRPGPWSNGRRFKVVAEATSTTVGVSTTSDRVVVLGELAPPVPGASVELVIQRRVSGTFVALSEKDVSVRVDGSFSTKFPRPKASVCRLVAHFAGDDLHRPSSDSVRFSC